MPSAGLSGGSCFWCVLIEQEVVPPTVVRATAVESPRAPLTCPGSVLPLRCRRVGLGKICQAAILGVQPLAKRHQVFV